jgi:hypothetical protein
MVAQSRPYVQPLHALQQRYACKYTDEGQVWQGFGVYHHCSIISYSPEKYVSISVYLTRGIVPHLVSIVLEQRICIAVSEYFGAGFVGSNLFVYRPCGSCYGSRLVSISRLARLKRCPMQPKRSFPASLLLFCCALLFIAGFMSACDVMPGLAATTADPPDPTALTPVDTSPGTLDVIVTISEFQNAPSHLSDMMITFSTALIEAPSNYVVFDDANEKVICNGVTMKLGDAPSYTFPVPRKEYTCTYSGNKKDGTPLAFVQMFDVHLKNTLSPQLPTVTSSGFSLHYTPEPSGSNCTIMATATDTAGDPAVVGSSMSATTGTYTGPSTSGLQGTGDIELTRTCNVSPPSTPFHSMKVTYVTTTSIEVTWTP